MKFYTRINSKEQIDSLKDISLHDKFEFQFSLFMKSVNHSRDYLLSVGKSVLFIRSGIIDLGNFDCITSDYAELKYDNFIKMITGEMI